MEHRAGVFVVGGFDGTEGGGWGGCSGRGRGLSVLTEGYGSRSDVGERRVPNGDG